MTTLTVGIATADEAYILVQDGEVSQVLSLKCDISNSTFQVVLNIESRSTTFVFSVLDISIFGVPSIRRKIPLLDLKPTSLSLIEAVYLFKAAACFLHSRYVLALVLPASLVLLLNLGVTITAVYIAHRYDNSLFCQRHFKLTWAIVHLRAGGRRGTSSRGRVLATLRNTLLLSLLLGLTWLLALPGASLPVQWINTILNCSQGFYILLYSVLANRAIRGQVYFFFLFFYSSFAFTSSYCPPHPNHLNILR